MNQRAFATRWSGWKPALLALAGVGFVSPGMGAAGGLHFEKIVLTDQYFCDGLNAGDFNRDGKRDVVAGPYWYEGPAFTTKHEFYPAVPQDREASPSNSLFSFVYDFNGDGRNDVVTAKNSHGWGLSWFEQTRDAAGAIGFREHPMMGTREEEPVFGVAFSQPHALDVADFDGDGLKDVLVGKRRWAHGPKGDVEPMGTPVVYWFQARREGNGSARFVPHLVDDASATGTQIVAADVNGDGVPDILTASKLGAFVFLTRRP